MDHRSRLRRLSWLSSSSLPVLFLATIGPSFAPVVLADAPTCQGQTATIYVDNGTIVGGPDDGQAYTGTLQGTSGDDVIVGTTGNDTIVGTDGHDLICGGGGVNSLDFSADPTGRSFQVTSNNAGISGDTAFTEVQNILAGAGNDAFVFSNGASLSGSINGGSGRDVLDFSAETTPVYIALTSDDNSGTSPGGAFTSIESILAGSSTDNRLTGRDIPNTWYITANNGGDLNSAISFSSVSSLTGGSSDDRFGVPHEKWTPR